MILALVQYRLVTRRKADVRLCVHLRAISAVRPSPRMEYHLTARNPAMAASSFQLSIDEYLRRRLMPVEGSIPRLAGIDMYGNSIPAGKVGGDLFEYINFQQRYNIDARVARAVQQSTGYMEPIPKGNNPRNSVDAHVQWLESRPNYAVSMATEYRK